MHIRDLVQESFQKTEEFLYGKYINELNTTKGSSNIQRKKHVINTLLEKFSLHIAKTSYLERFKLFDATTMGKWSSVGTLKLITEKPEEFEKIYELLDDKDSKEVFDWFIKFRVAYAFVGFLASKVFPPPISEEEFNKELSKLVKNVRGKFLKLDVYSINSELEAVALSWVFGQYELKDIVEVQEDDVVFDIGAYKGETSIWFISKGANTVYAFEPDPFNYEVLTKNIMGNNLESKIIAKQLLLGSTNSLERLIGTGTGGSTTSFVGKFEVEQITLDSFIEKERVKKVDFLKLDTEGAELEILKGSINTIKKFKPKLAISVYHKPDDIIEIPKFIKSIIPEAKFYLSHKNYDWSETVLFVKIK